MRENRAATLGGVSNAHRDELGVSMIATLVVVVILGVLVTIVLAQSNNSASKGPGGASRNGTTTTVPHSIGGASQESTVAACEADFQSVTIAIGVYHALNGAPPPPGTSWATSTSRGGPFMTSWPDDPRNFTLVWNGSLLSVVPATGAASHGSSGSASPKSGCFAS